MDDRKNQKHYTQGHFTGERAMFGMRDAQIADSVFADGESPLKESENLALKNVSFEYKYPLWYDKHVSVKDSAWLQMGRAGVWYTDDITVDNAVIEAPKNFRRCKGLSLSHVFFSDAAETLWHCEDVDLKNVQARGDYFAMDCKNVYADGLYLIGNYGFDGVQNLELHNSRLLTKDAFWNCENVTVYDSYISGEYFGWNSKHVTLINCIIESLQGMCYIENLVMKNCKLINTTYAFEYSTVDVEVTGRVDSILNPKSGVIHAEEIGNLILEPDKIDPQATQILCEKIEKRSEKPEW